jgi:hypothetical protein
LSSTRPANHHRAREAGEDTGQPLNRLFERHRTDWDAIPADRVMRNLRRHLRQLQAYLDTAIEDMEAGQWEGIIGAMLYPARPPQRPDAGDD